MARTYYAIGDVHGEAERLAQLHAFILQDVIDSEIDDPEIVHLGDYVDRGPDSRGVIAQIMLLEGLAPCPVRALLGNHEEMMLHAYDQYHGGSESHWAQNGGAQTVASYADFKPDAEDWRDQIDPVHIAWLRTLPTLIRDEERKIAFVHAGIDPKAFPNCKDEIRVWTRSRKFFESERWPERPELDGWMVVHGHTPQIDGEPEVEARRINVDTGAVFGGPLTCVVLAPEAPPRFLRA